MSGFGNGYPGLWGSPPLAHPGYIASRFYPTLNCVINYTTALTVAAIDVIYFYAWIPPATINFTGAKMRVQTGGAGSSVKGGIWANSTVSMRPLGAPLYADNNGVATTASTTDVSIALGAGTLYAGVCYWIGTKYTGTLPQMWSIPVSATSGNYLSGIASGGTTGSGNITFADTYSNNMPTIAEGGTFSATNSVIPHMWMVT